MSRLWCSAAEDTVTVWDSPTAGERGTHTGLGACGTSAVCIRGVRCGSIHAASDGGLMWYWLAVNEQAARRRFRRVRQLQVPLRPRVHWGMARVRAIIFCIYLHIGNAEEQHECLYVVARGRAMR